MVFSAVNKLSVVQQIKQLPAVNLVKANEKLQLRKVLKLLDYVKCCQQVQTRHASVTLSHHGVGFATSSLTVSKTGGLGSLESAMDKGLNALAVNL